MTGFCMCMLEGIMIYVASYIVALCRQAFLFRSLQRIMRPSSQLRLEYALVDAPGSAIELAYINAILQLQCQCLEA